MRSVSDILISFSLFSFTVLAGALFAPAPSANAATAFDDYVTNTSELTVRDFSDSPESTQDITSTYLDIINDPQYGCRDTVAWQTFNTLNELGYGVTVINTSGQLHVPSRDTRVVTIIMDLQNRPLVWNVSSAIGLQAFSTHMMTIQYFANDGFFCSGQTVNSQETISTPPQYQTVGGMPRIFYSTVPPNYPIGYEGQIISDVVPQPPVISDEVPQWRILSLINFQARIIDTAFNTFDPNVWTCEEDLTPIIHYTLTGGSETQSGIFSPTVPLNLQLPEIYEQTDYVLTGYYECPDSTTFSETSSIEFQVDLNGNQSFNFFEDCFVETFPFIQFNECISNLRHVIQLMGFNLAIFGQDWVMPNTDCYALTDLHEWIGLSNNVVCKQFPSYVRTTVTPFISFAIGLMALRFLASRRRDDM